MSTNKDGVANFSWSIANLIASEVSYPERAYEEDIAVGPFVLQKKPAQQKSKYAYLPYQVQVTSRFKFTCAIKFLYLLLRLFYDVRKMEKKKKNGSFKYCIFWRESPCWESDMNFATKKRIWGYQTRIAFRILDERKEPGDEHK